MAILVLSNLPDLPSARALADALLTGRLAACISIGAPVESIYHWRGAREMASEVSVAIKTRAALYPLVESTIRAHHPYELPEIIALPITHALPGYLDWILAETSPEGG